MSKKDLNQKNRPQDRDRNELQLEQLDQVAGGGGGDTNLTDLSGANILLVDYGVDCTGEKRIQYFAHKDLNGKWQGTFLDVNPKIWAHYEHIEDVWYPFTELTDAEQLDLLEKHVNGGKIVGIVTRDSTTQTQLFSYGNVTDLT